LEGFKIGQYNYGKTMNIGPLVIYSYNCGMLYTGQLQASKEIQGTLSTISSSSIVWSPDCF
jgi:hypothetical protein